MTPDGFLTFLALLVAIYTVASPVSKLRVRLEIGFLQAILAISAVGLALYFEFFDALKQSCNLGVACKWVTLPADSSFTPEHAAFLVVLGWMIAAWLIHNLTKVGASSLPVLSKLVDELLLEERYSELLVLVDPHLALIDRGSQRKLLLQRLHDWFAGLRGIGSTEYTLKKLDGEKKGGMLRIPTSISRVFGWLYLVVPAGRKHEKCAQDILRSIYRADDLRRFMVKQRPYAAISLLRLNRLERFEFCDRLFGDLIADTGSALYLEIREQQTTRYHIPEFPQHNRLLHFLFSNAKTAHALGVWKPVGEYLLRRLDPAIDPGYVVYLNGPATHFEEEQWNDPTYVGIQFFRLMVEAAMNQGIEWHMWLYYLPLLLKKLEENYDTSNPLVDTTVEFPTRSARLIYEILNALEDFVKAAADLAEESPHRNVPDQFGHDNGNIPVSAALALGQGIKVIATSNRLGDRFATYMHECILHDFRVLAREGQIGRLRNFLIQSIIRGGDAFGGRADNNAYGQRLATLVEGADHVLWEVARDYIAALDEKYPDSLSERLKPRPTD